jgi:hypothetical protein
MHYFWRRNHEYLNQSEASSVILNFKLFRKATTLCCEFGNWVCISFDAQVAIWHTDGCPTHFDHKSWNENPQVHHCNRISKIVSLMRSLSNIFRTYTIITETERFVLNEWDENGCLYFPDLFEFVLMENQC